MNLSTKLNDLLAENKLDEAINLLIDRAKNDYNEGFNDLIHLKSRYTNNEQENNIGSISRDEFLRVKAQIIKSFQNIIKEIPSDLLSSSLDNISQNEEFIKTKSDIFHKISDLIELVNHRRYSLHNSDYGVEVQKKFDAVDFDDLIFHIELDNCILFIGPEISINKAGESLHDNYYKSISSSLMEYNIEDSFFMPGSGPRVQQKSMRYYKEIFPNENQIGLAVLEKLAQLPFSLIVSYCPDDSMTRIFDKYKYKHNTITFDGNKITVDNIPTIDNPVIYNALGCAAYNGRYVFTHEQFRDYIKKEASKLLPEMIGTKIKQTKNSIFLGFDFNKWHFRLLMFELGSIDNSVGYALEANEVKSVHKDFLNKQFGFSFINSNYDDFANYLLRVGIERNVYKFLKPEHADNILNKLNEIRKKATNMDKSEYRSIQNELEIIEKEIDNKPYNV